MSGLIIDYLIEYGDISFKEMRFTEVDAAILCKLSYFNFDDFVAGPETGMPSVSLKNIMLMEEHDKLFDDSKYDAVHRQMIDLMLKGCRFSDIRVAAFANYHDKESQTQFAAVTFLLGTNRMFLVFRGTDDSLVGLKEDFNLLYMDHAPCHQMAMNYIRSVSKQFSRKMYIGGHSKGGHLAVYACMFMPDEIQNRITRIYSLDGLGIRASVIEKGNYENIQSKIIKLIPQSSLIGMMMQTDENYEVVRSSGALLTQHNVLTWETSGNKFIREEKLKNSAIFLDKTMNGWLESQDDESRKIFIDTLYSIVDSCKAEHLHEMVSNRGQKLNQMLSEARGLDESTSIQIRRVFKAFIVVAAFYLRSDVDVGIKNGAIKTKKHIKDYLTRHERSKE